MDHGILNPGEFGDFGQIPGPSSLFWRGAAAAAFLCHYYLLRP
jgi:hypothetical protein